MRKTASRRLLLTALIVGIIAPFTAAAWLFLLGHAPVPPLSKDAGKLPEPEYAVTWVPGIGPRR